MTGDGVDLTVLGGGVAGLAAACAARERGIACVLYEAADRLGGNGITLEHEGFRFDAGAHRFHDRFPEVTRHIESLLGADLRRVDAPSRIHLNGVFVDFPLSPLDLLRKLPAGTLLRAALDLLSANLLRGRACRNLEEYAIRAYGRTIAGTFLTNYSEKLWGLPSERLSTAAAGKRLRGLSWKTFLLDAFRGAQARTTHLDGRFLYPRGGIGRIADALAARCAPGTLHTRTPVTAIRRHRDRIVEIEVSGARRARAAAVDRVICTLPLDTTLRLLDPPPPARILEVGRALRFRHVVVVALFLEREGLSQYATTYFPEKAFPFTRVHEPRCRCSEMAPPGRTSLVAEIPCSPGDALWRLSDSDLEARVREGLERLGWIRPEEIRGAAVHRMRKAYPVPSAGIEATVEEIHDWLGRFANLTLIGRAARFEYHHIHDLVRLAHRAVKGTPIGTVPVSPDGQRP